MGIVDAYDDPNAEPDLAVYRATFGMPPCTTANGCFRKLNQLGKAGPYPVESAQWALEISTDLDMVSAICPHCHIVLVESDDNLPASLVSSVNTAIEAGATVVADSWGANEFSGETEFDAALYHPGIPIVFAGGDDTYNGEWFPAASRYGVAVGGTTLSPARNRRGWVETAAAGASSGCSLYETKPSWQHDPGCTMRTTNDVAAFFDTRSDNPSPYVAGAAIYDTFAPVSDPTTYEAVAFQQLSPTSGWSEGGGTSTAAQIVAAVYALASNGRVLKFAQSLYTHSGLLFDTTDGTNGDGVFPTSNNWPAQNLVVHDCGNYLCRAGPGYDGPTGNGTPNGIGAF